MKIYVSRDIMNNIVCIDDKFFLKYISFNDMKDEFFDDLTIQAIRPFGLFLGEPNVNCSLKKEIYDWCIENGFRYKKIQVLEKTKTLEGTTGILFTCETNAVAFKLRWL